MPYTPPSQQSPAASRPESPPRSRDGKAMKPLPGSSPFQTGPRPNLPRSNSSSTSYLHRHRRSPSSSQVQLSHSHSCLDASTTSSDQAFWVHVPHASLRQSPPPVNNLKIPTGTIISPPDSGNNSSDDEGLTMVQRGKKLNNLADLQAAISDIERERENKPGWAEEEKKKARSALGLDTNITEASVTLQLPSADSRPPLSKEARKISHSRSATETNIQLPRAQSYSPPDGSSDSDLDDVAAGQKPKMLRKKSGELVRPALRPASARRRPSSMPGTPTFGKAVHFSSDLEHVRHFLQVDRPLAVSAETSPAEETFEDDSEYPFPGGLSSSIPSTKKQFEWDIHLANFPADTAGRKSMPVRVEKVFLSSNKKTLIGTVAVQNLAFHKTVVARFTFDYWKTTSEVTAEYSTDAQRQSNEDGLDRFNFNIQLTDQTNLGTKTLFFCVRYAVNGQEFWDSNNAVNFQVDFSKRQVPAKSEPSGSSNEATRHLNSLPRSRSPQNSPGLRKNFDDFGLGFDSHWAARDTLPRAKSELNILDDSSTPLKFRNKASGNAFEDLPGRRQAKGAAQPLGNRYDFNKSLSAALTAASSALGERSGLSSPPPAPAKASTSKAAPLWAPSGAPVKAEPQPQPNASPSGLSYEELVEKYCFFGNGKASPSRSNKAASFSKAQVDGSQPSGSNAPSPPAASSPQESVQTAVESVAERFSRSVSPSRSELSSRAASPSSFGYPYHQPLNNGFAASTAIRG